MDACGNKKPKAEKSKKHEKHVPSYMAGEVSHSVSEDFTPKKKK